MNTNLSEKSLNEIHQTVKEFFDNEGDDGKSIADKTIKSLKKGNYTFELWDALGCDDLGLVKKNPEIQNLYLTITKQWTQSIKKTKH